jgi:hypothetical protein
MIVMLCVQLGCLLSFSSDSRSPSDNERYFGAEGFGVPEFRGVAVPLAVAARCALRLTLMDDDGWRQQREKQAATTCSGNQSRPFCLISISLLFHSRTRKNGNSRGKRNLQYVSCS